MSWRNATVVVAIVIGFLIALGLTTEVNAAPGKPYPPGYRCAPVWMKCYGPGKVPSWFVRPPAPAPKPVPSPR